MKEQPEVHPQGRSHLVRYLTTKEHTAYTEKVLSINDEGL